MFKLFIQEIMELHNRNIWDEKMLGNKSIGIDKCPFCIDEDGLTIWEGKYWNIRHNKYPYNGLKKHLLLMPYRHIEHTKDLNDNELLEIKQAEEFLSNFYKKIDYCSLIRQTNGGKSINHIHYHYLPGKLLSCDLEKILK